MDRKSANRLYFLPVLVVFVIGLAMFGVLDSFRISTGDDLGYMFTDSKLHEGGGVQVQSAADCLLTQSRHYFTTNGRIIVHFVVQLMVGVLPTWVFTLCNTLMFGLLWLLVLKSAKIPGNSIKISAAIISFFLLVTLEPWPGMTMLSLVAFAVGYMWTAVAGLLWIHILYKIPSQPQNKSRILVYCIISLFIGMLHEGVSIPIGFAILVWLVYSLSVCIKHRDSVLKLLDTPRVAYMAAFGVGALITILAPGNFNHLQGAGGFSVNALMARQSVLWSNVLFCGIGVLAIAGIILSVYAKLVGWKEFMHVWRQNAFLLVIVVGALLLASVTFTSPRQLFWPTTLCIVILFRMTMMWMQTLDVAQRRGIVFALILIIGITFPHIYNDRAITYHQWQRFIQNYKSAVSKGCNTAIYDVSKCTYNNPLNGKRRFNLSYYSQDPAYGDKLLVFFDGYTKRALSRIYCGGKDNVITHIVPDRDGLIASNPKPENSETCIPKHLDLRYDYICVPPDSRAKPWSDPKHKYFIPYEEYKSDLYRIIVFRRGYDKVYLN